MRSCGVGTVQFLFYLFFIAGGALAAHERLFWKTTKERLHEVGAFDFEMLCISMDSLAYVLGNLPALENLMGIPLTPCARKVAIFHMVCGYIFSYTRYNGAIPPHYVFSVLEANPLFQEVLEATLLQYFGLSEEEHVQIIEEVYMNSIQRFDE